ncbi:AAA family ATPase, partial [bacterium]|nr:AAA family ATPase [bacterium]
MLHKILIKGFKSIREQELEFGALNVFIGGNGVGKSNLVGVFDFLSQVVRQRLQTFTGEAGGANTLLHFGRKKTEKMSLAVEFRSGKDANIYKFDLIPTAEDRFLFESETAYYWDTAQYSTPYNDDQWFGHSEAKLTDSARRVAKYVRSQLDSYRIYHFHDTSSSSAMKQTGDLADNRFLRPDAGNLAAFLYLLQQKWPQYFANIEDTVRQVAPFFGRLKLAPSEL